MITMLLPLLIGVSNFSPHDAPIVDKIEIQTVKVAAPNEHADSYRFTQVIIYRLHIKKYNGDLPTGQYVAQWELLDTTGGINVFVSESMYGQQYRVQYTSATGHIRSLRCRNFTRNTSHIDHEEHNRKILPRESRVRYGIKDWPDNDGPNDYVYD